MPVIALNAIGRYTGGVESYIYNLVKALLDQDQSNNYYLFMSKTQELVYKDLLAYKNLKLISYNINCSNPFARILCENTLLPLDVIKHKINIVHHLCNYIPHISPYKSIVTVHDLCVFYYHNNFPEYNETKAGYNYFKKIGNFVASKAQKIITVSEFTKRQFLDKFRVDPRKLEVVGESYDTRKDKNIINPDILEKYNITKPYILTVSVIRPHKNFDFLVRVFNRLKAQYNLPHQLVIVGDVHFGPEKFFNELEKSKFKDEILYMGRVNDEDLSSIYNFADIFVYPSLYEGFGIPLIEAMYFGVPVVSSNAASLPEVGGNACLYFNPCDENDACNKIYTVLNNEVLKNNLVFNRKERLDHYSWNNIATRVLDIYNDVLGSKND